MTIACPDDSTHNKTEELQLENQRLKEEIAKIHKTLEVISGIALDNKTSKTQVLQSALAAKESELAEVRHRVKDLESQLEEQRSVTKEYFHELQRLQAANSELQLELEQQLNKGSKVNKEQ